MLIRAVAAPMPASPAEVVGADADPMHIAVDEHNKMATVSIGLWFFVRVRFPASCTLRGDCEECSPFGNDLVADVRIDVVPCVTKRGPASNVGDDLADDVVGAHWNHGAQFSATRFLHSARFCCSSHMPLQRASASSLRL